jgi:hypothetical protein
MHYQAQLAYEDVVSGRNLLACDLWATPGVRPLHDTWVHQHLAQICADISMVSLAARPRRYGFPIGCFHNPADWARDPCVWLPTQVSRDLDAGRAVLIFDQSQEGNGSADLWAWFYHMAARRGINPQQIIYLTGDQLSESAHHTWCDTAAVSQRMCVINSNYWRYVTARNLSDTAARSLTYEQAWHQAEPRRLFNCLNRMPHAHRRWFVLLLAERGLLAQGLVSMDQFDHVPPCPSGLSFDDRTWPRLRTQLPLLVDKPEFVTNYSCEVNPWIYAHSWLTVVTETDVSQHMLFLSEKVWKPMFCFSPFMVLGNHGTLRRLRELGFNTFPELWDESYDDQPDLALRMQMIADQIERVSGISDKQSWIAQAEPALRHNQQLAWQLWHHSHECGTLVAELQARTT